MSFVRAGQLARETPYARPDDSLGLVAENLRESNYGTIPVFDSIEVEPRRLRSEILLGVVDERDLSRLLTPIPVAQREVVRIGGDTIEYSKYANGAPNGGSRPADAKGAPTNGAPHSAANALGLT